MNALLRFGCVTLLLSCALWLTTMAHAQTDAAAPAPSDDALGFAEPPTAADPSFAAPAADGGSTPGVQIATPDAPDTPSPFTLSGGLRVQSAARLQGPSERRLAKLRQVLLLRLDYAHSVGALELRGVASLRAESDFAYLLNRDRYDGPTLDTYGAQILPGETYLELRGSWLDVTVGEQIVNLGQGEVLSVLDLVNPRDLREPLSSDLEELRMPVLLSRISISHDRMRLQLIAVHEPYFGLVPPPLGEFSPFRTLLLESPALAAALGTRELRSENFPKRTFTNFDATQFHAKLGWSGDGIDLALQLSSVLDSLGVPTLPTAAAFADENIALPLYHPRYLVLGQSGAWQLGAFVLRWELAVQLARPTPLRRTDTTLPIWSNERLDMLSAMLGVTYALDGSTSAGLEVQPSYVLANPARRADGQLTTLFPVEAPQLALRINHTFLRDRATLALLGYLLGLAPVNASAVRAELGYAILDALHVAVGVMSYFPSGRFGPLYGFGRNDRVFCNFSWDFEVS